jgi:two-component system nitrogen regulation sensor histidine kinase NtrY
MPKPPTWLDRHACWVALLATLPAAEWLREPAVGWVVAAGVLSVVALAGAYRARPGGRVIAGVLLLLLAAMAIGQVRISRIQRDWPAEHEARVSRAFQRLRGELRASLRTTERLADRALQVAEGDRSAAFEALGRDLPRDGAETAVAILEPTGVPWAWAGRHRLVPDVDGDSLAARFSRFFATLESRRHSPTGRVVVATVLIWADSAVPRPERSLAQRFGASAGVQLRVFPPGAAPRGGEIFDYTEPTQTGDRLLFSLQPTPPDQSVVQDEIIARASRFVGLVLVLVLAAGLLLADTPAGRLSLLVGVVWAVLRAPLGPAIGLDDLFSPATFHRGVLRPFATSPGNLLVTASALLLLGIWLWGRRPVPRWWSATLGSVLLLGAPYLVRALGRGILPPQNGVTTGQWVTWQVMLTVATSAVIVLAAALFRGSGPERGRHLLGVAVGVVVALAAAIIGVVIWQPRIGWPEWYTFLWLPPLFLVVLPAPRWATITGTAIVAGLAAALVTWGAELDARVTAAQRELARLGEVKDDLATPYLERFGEQVLAGPEPTASSALYVLWRSSLLAGQEYPVRMGLWEPDGTRRAELTLDALDLPAPLIAALVKGLDPARTHEVVPVSRVPGRHYVLLQRLRSGRVLVCAVGPRTRLLPPTRLARLLRAPPEGAPLFELSLSPPYATEALGRADSRWWRVGNEVRHDRLLALPGGSRHVHAVIELRPLPMLLVRGALLLAVDCTLIGILWLIGTLRLRGLRRRWAVRRLARSFRVRLAVTLALFFIVPAAGFTVWGLGRLTDEANHTRDLLITSVLRDAVLTAGGLLQEPSDYLSEGLIDLSNRLEAELVLYSGGRLVAASAPILEDLSLVEPLVDARIFQRLTRGDELELTRQATTYVAPVRVGYRVVQAGPPGGIGILAMPQLTYDWSRSQDQREVTFLLLFATLCGVGAAMLGAQLVAWALSRPVADLRRSAAAVGRGEPLPVVRTPPAEFEQVFNGFARMAEDIRASQAALDGARQRTAAVLANVATAVVALDPDGGILLANGRARQMLGAPLAEGSRFTSDLAPGWAPLIAVVSSFLSGADPAHSVDIEIGTRTVRVQLARLGQVPGGTVLAVDDLTDVTQAARVLAWGEMARQVAHEIKNPLTPIRLGIQHLLRVRRDRPDQVNQVLEDTSERILSEIDRLDTIARAFSRFGLPASATAPLVPVDLSATAREVASLYHLAADGTSVTVEGPDSVTVPARLDEIKEVLANLLENARAAGAHRVRIGLGPGLLEVTDDGRGIAPELLPRIFEPRFSTTTSGSGLGLAIVRRLAESWGATVEVDSRVGRGTNVSVRWLQSDLPRGRAMPS